VGQRGRLPLRHTQIHPQWTRVAMGPGPVSEQMAVRTAAAGWLAHTGCMSWKDFQLSSWAEWLVGSLILAPDFAIMLEDRGARSTGLQDR
jgi:hypothetical protein